MKSTRQHTFYKESTYTTDLDQNAQICTDPRRSAKVPRRSREGPAQVRAGPAQVPRSFNTAILPTVTQVGESTSQSSSRSQYQQNSSKHTTLSFKESVSTRFQVINTITAQIPRRSLKDDANLTKTSDIPQKYYSKVPGHTTHFKPKLGVLYKFKAYFVRFGHRRYSRTHMFRVQALWM